MEDNLDERIKPKVENESGFTQAGNTCDMPNRVHVNTSAIVKSEPDSNCEDDDGDSKSVTKVKEETSKEEPNCETEERRMTRSMRNRMMTQNKQDSGLCCSSKSVGPAKISYCEDSSSADSENEYSSPKKKRTKVSAKSKSSKSSTGTGGKSNSRGQEKNEIPCSVAVIKQEDSSGETKDSLSNCSENINVIRNVPVKGVKAKVVKKHSIDIEEIKENSFKEVCDIFRKYHIRNFTRQNPEVMAACRSACKKYLVYRCKICMSNSGNMDCAKDHFENKHSRDQKKSKEKDAFVDYFNELYKCDQCGYTTRYIRNLVKHVDCFHNNDKQEMYSCDKCKFTTFDKYRFSSHLNSHVRPTKKTECHLCHLSYVGIKKHLQLMHAESTRQINCPQCPSTFGNVTKMRVHQKNVHPPNGSNFVCKECGKVCGNGRNLVRHTRRTHYQTQPRFECQLCKIKLKTKEGLDLHMSRHRGDVKRFSYYSCADCEKSFSMKQSLQNHIRKKHKTCDGPEKNHLCEICGKSFEHKRILERHMVVHTKEKKFVCATCNKSFTQICSLKSHQVVHTGIKPFECVKCGNKYSQKYPLTQHIKKHHPD